MAMLMVENFLKLFNLSKRYGKFYVQSYFTIFLLRKNPIAFLMVVSVGYLLSAICLEEENWRCAMYHIRGRRFAVYSIFQ